MKRFYHERSRGWLRHMAVILIFLVLFLLFFLGISKVSKRTEEVRMQTLEQAISRGIAHCYAYEGYYPKSLEYLKEHYGISYDTEEFFVDYRALGGNLFPDVTIIKR